MKRRLFLTLVGLIALLVAGVSVAPGQGPVKAEAPQQNPAQEPSFQTGDRGVYLVGNTDAVASTLVAGGEEIRITGRASFYLSGSESMIKEGALLVNGFSLAYFGVPQQVLAGDLETTVNTGVLGFAADTSQPQRLRYDANSGTIAGEIRGYVDAAYMSTLIKEPATDDKGDQFETATQPATLALEMQINALLTGEIEEVVYDRAQLVFKLHADDAKFESYVLTSFDLVTEELLEPALELVDWWRFEVANKLCVQPVFIGKFKIINNFPWGPISISAETTGDGLAFGQPGAAAEWAKADVGFEYRDPKVLWKSGYWVVDTNGTSNSAEQLSLLAEVDDDDCIELYFIDEFDPVSWGGGGATWGSGTAGSKIITSDANAAGGIDFNHLAHELGHVMALRHPDDPATANAMPGSSGTVMCGSGYLNDNPSVNSQENTNNLTNPLFQFALKVRSAGPDCQNSLDCGACP
jgi:hypothetical protein